MAQTGYFKHQVFIRKTIILVGIVLTAMLLSSFSAWSFDSTFPDNTVYIIHEFESGFHGPDPFGGWGTNDHLFAIEATVTFIADGTVNATTIYDDP